MRVSIHAPVMDANWQFDDAQADRQVSIHAPVMDANYYFGTSPKFCSFNPRARDGRELLP